MSVYHYFAVCCETVDIAVVVSDHRHGERQPGSLGFLLLGMFRTSHEVVLPEKSTELA